MDEIRQKSPWTIELTEDVMHVESKLQILTEGFEKPYKDERDGNLQEQS